MVRDLLPTDRELALYGEGWDPLAPEHARGRHVGTDELRRLYSSADVVLNDHWPDMAERGYLSNRLFDALACEAFVISDAAATLEAELPGAVVVYREPADRGRRRVRPARAGRAA